MIEELTINELEQLNSASESIQKLLAICNQQLEYKKFHDWETRFNSLYTNFLAVSGFSDIGESDERITLAPLPFGLSYRDKYILLLWRLGYSQMRIATLTGRAQSTINADLQRMGQRNKKGIL